MSRHEPFSRRPRRDALDRLLDTAATPRPSADLAARIARDVPRLAQVAPLTADLPGAEDQAAHSSFHVRRRATRGWLLAAGMGALAAGFASILIGSPNSAPTNGAPQAPIPLAATKPASPIGPASPVREAIRLADAPGAAPPAAPAARLRLARVPERVGAPGPISPTEPLPPHAAPPEAMSALAPSTASAVDLAGPPSAPPRGQMGPVLPQGHAYSGGATGGIPSGAPVTMSGGPSGN